MRRWHKGILISILHQGCVYKIGRQCPPGFVGGDLGDVCLPAGGAQAFCLVPVLLTTL